ncbi:hypothetical protein TIFTF001_053162 [Ficus carica]|uniref:Uncharacterized protein n=1 Tax=Ficus carica TaxID=3494 RepID=A0AA88EGF7_FICCA|nr:hypothetical protein TIFTF001_053162 [Ficus carica]
MWVTGVEGGSPAAERSPATEKTLGGKYYMNEKGEIVEGLKAVHYQRLIIFIINTTAGYCIYIPAVLLCYSVGITSTADTCLPFFDLLWGQELNTTNVLVKKRNDVVAITPEKRRDLVSEESGANAEGYVIRSLLEDTLFKSND